MQIYFDHAATSFPKAPGVGAAMARYIDTICVNVNRSSYDSAQQAALDLLDTRELLCKLFHFNTPELAIFTPGNTYAINQVLYGFLKPGDQVLTSSMEHNAVMRPLQALTARGVSYTCLPCDEEGRLRPEDLKKAITKHTRLVVIQHASNVSGTVQPLAEIAQICQHAGLPLVVDAAQTAGHLPIDFEALGLCALCLPGHKGLLGPSGIGALLLSPSFAKQLTPLVLGGTGSQSDSLDIPSAFPDRLEAGTPNLPGIYGLHAALQWWSTQDLATLHEEEMALCERFLNGVLALPGIQVAGPKGIKDRVAVVSLSFTGRDNAIVSDYLQQQGGLALRCGLHCAPMAHRSLGTYPEGTVRFSFSHTNTAQEVDHAIAQLKAVSEGKADEY